MLVSGQMNCSNALVRVLDWSDELFKGPGRDAGVWSDELLKGPGRLSGQVNC